VSQTCEITRNSETIRPYDSSRSSKVIDLGVNRKPICDFLLAMNSNFGRILHLFEILLHKGRKITFLPYPTLLWGPRSGEPRQNFLMKLTPEKLEGWRYRMVKIVWSYLQPFLTDPPVWQTDGRTDGIAMAYMRYSIYAVACNNTQKSKHKKYTNKSSTLR